ncbi:GcrA family cell cycle regulator [Chelatococcus reniformis]|nr:GcrA family cell cycle regulator [Chelatococcus reniformis]
MNDPGNIWSDDRVELLKRLWAEGLSASQIATAMGGITRNAVIGKVHRLGLSGRAKAAASGVPKPRKSVAAPPRSTAASPRPAQGPTVQGNTVLAVSMRIETDAYEPHPATQAADVVVPLSERVTITELRENMCRWPLGDPTSAEFRFCGNRTTPGQPYCAHHARIAYQPPERRRR